MILTVRPLMTLPEPRGRLSWRPRLYWQHHESGLTLSLLKQQLHSPSCVRGSAAMSIALPSHSRSRDSLRLNPSGLDDRPPFLDLGPLKCSKRFRRLLLASRNLLADVSEPVAHRWIGECF